MKKLNQKPGMLSGWIASLGASFFSAIFLLTDRALPVTSAESMLKAMKGSHVEALCLILLLTLLYRRVWTLQKPRLWGFSLAGGLVFTLCDLVGFRIYFQDSLTMPEVNPFSLALEGFCGLGALFLFSGLLSLLFHRLDAHPVRIAETPRSQRWLGSGSKAFFLYFGILMAISIPLQIYFYPGITNPDSFVQISEAMGLTALTDRHPFLHTLMMRMVIGLGRSLFGTIGAGITLYTFYQSVMVNLAVSFLLVYLSRRRIHPALRLFTLLYFAVHPAIACYTITLWKDIWLSYFLMLYVLLLIEAALNSENFFKGNRHMICLLLVILGFLFSKNTGIAVLVGTVPFLLISCRKYWKKITLVTVLALTVFSFMRLVIIPQAGIQKGRMSEPFSVPMQQLARTCVHEGDQLTNEQRDTIREIFPYEDLPRLYEPHLADNVKLSLNEEAFSANPMRYVKCWLEVGAAHPRMYLESFLANSCGYWYPDVTYWVVDPTWYYNSGEIMEKIGEPDPDMENYTVDQGDYTRRHYFVHLYEMLQTVPGISTLLSTAITFWAEFVLFLLCLLKKKYKMLIPLLVPFFTWIVCIFSPVIAEYRYAFPAVVCLPILAAFTLQDEIRWTESLGIGKKIK